MTRLVPTGLVRSAVAIAVICLLIVVTMGLLLGGQRVGTAFDQTVYWAVYKQFVGENELLRAMLVPTEPVLLVVVIGLIVMIAVARHRPRLAILAVAGPLTAVTLTSVVLKPLFGRTINNSLAFPSGHTSGLVAVLTVLVIAVISNVGPPWRKSLVTLVIVSAVVVTAVGATALIGMKYHYVTDTVGGACMAVATVLSVALVIDWTASRRRRTTAEIERTAASGVAL